MLQIRSGKAGQVPVKTGRLDGELGEPVQSMRQEMCMQSVGSGVLASRSVRVWHSDRSDGVAAH